MGKIAKAPVNIPKDGTATTSSAISLGSFYGQSVTTKQKASLYFTSFSVPILSSQNSSSRTIKITLKTQIS
jgi:hypothetical protein